MSIDWEQHFRAMKAVGPKPKFGTVLGEHTVAELKDLLAAKTVEVDRVEKAYQKILDLGPPKPEVTAWKTDWDTFKERWSAATKEAQDAIDAWSWNPFVPDNMAAAESQYVGVLKALSQAYPELHTVPGDLNDLGIRLTQLGGEIDNSPLPQPQPNSDFDFNALQTTNAAAQVAQHAADALTLSKKTWVIIGLGVGLGLFILPRLLIPAPFRMIIR